MKKLSGSFLLLFLPLFLYSEVLEIRFHPENKNQFYLQNSRLQPNGVELSEGDAVYRRSFHSFFLSFEDQLPSESNISFFQESMFGKQSGLFYESNNFIRFLFEASFEFGLVLEFWLKPFTVDNGTVLSTEYLSPDGINRNLEVYFKSGKLFFSFEKLFLDQSAAQGYKSRILASYHLIPLKEWHHHRLTYNPATGEINYYLDGELNSQAWATEDGNPGSSVMHFEVPSDWVYVLGKGYRGLMDNFFLSPNFKNSYSVSSYDRQKGLIYTRVLRLPSLASIYDLDLISQMRKNTFQTLEYRSSLTPFSDSTPEEILPWQDFNLVHPDKNPPIKTHYIQFRITLFPSPDGSKSPLLQALRVKYNIMDMPSIPLGVAAHSSEGKILLSFRESPNRKIVAYKIYYGTRQNEYWGQGAKEGDSPIFLPITELERKKNNGRLYYELSGLKPYEVYFLRVAAIDEEGLESEMSSEVSVRIRKLP